MSSSRFSSHVLTTLLVVGVTSGLLNAANYTVDPNHSTAVFRVRHNSVAYYNGRFNELSGSFDFDSSNLAASSINVEIKAESVFTNNQRRDDHLRSPDFFNAAQFPTITFKSSKVEKAGEKRYKVTGDLTIRGVTKTITVDVEHIGDGERRGRKLVGFSTQFQINRRDFNVSYGPEEAIGSDVTIRLDLEAISE